jgi:hypothetical protein
MEIHEVQIVSEQSRQRKMNNEKKKEKHMLKIKVKTQAKKKKKKITTYATIFVMNQCSWDSFFTIGRHPRGCS